MGTGFVGASLARQQGISTLARLRKDLDAGRLPAEAIIDGVMILVAAAVLITPGVLTDLFGFLCLVPAFRRPLKALREAAVRARGAGGNRPCQRGGRRCGRPGTAPADEERNATPPRQSVNTTLTTAVGSANLMSSAISSNIRLIKKARAFDPRNCAQRWGRGSPIQGTLNRHPVSFIVS